MYGDKQANQAAEACLQAPSVPVDQDQTPLFGADALGDGTHPISRMKEQESALTELVARRLTRARKAAGYREWEVSQHLGHANLTMISLFENARRAPSLRNLTLLADLYGVTTDYVLGRTDDLGLSPEEGNQALLVGIIKGALTAHVEKFLEGIARATAVTVEGMSQDHVMLDQLADLSEELSSALAVIRQHHGDRFDELRGGAKLKRLISELDGQLQARRRRKQTEKALAEYEHPVCTPDEIAQAVQQALFA